MTAISTGVPRGRRPRRSSRPIRSVIEVELIQWPDDAEQLRLAREAGIPRLLLVPRSERPPVADDPLEDWIRQPSTSTDIALRIDVLSSRARTTLGPVHPWMDHEGVANERGALALTAIDRRLVALLVEHYGEVVPRSRLLEEGWPEGGVTSNVLEAHAARLRRQLIRLGLRLRARRYRGYVLEPSPERSTRATTTTVNPPTAVPADRPTTESDND